MIRVFQVVILLLCVGVIAYAGIKVTSVRIVITEFDYQHLDGELHRLAGREIGGRLRDQKLYKARYQYSDYEWLKSKDLLIAHRLGDTKDQSNTLASLNDSYATGFRYFEVDLMLSGGKILCAHDETDLYTKGKCEFGDLIDFAIDHDVYFILDVKSDFEKTYSLISSQLKAEGVGRQFIPQIYYFYQLEHIDLDLFAGPIPTAYRMNLPGSFVVDKAIELGVRAITLPPKALNDIKPTSSLRVFTHGVNKVENLVAFRQGGISGFYLNLEAYKALKTDHGIGSTE